MNDDVMLTTFDNPFDPFTEFVAWWKFDQILGHDCCGLLAKTANISDAFSIEHQNYLIKKAIEFICTREPNVYRRAYPKTSQID